MKISFETSCQPFRPIQPLRTNSIQDTPSIFCRDSDVLQIALAALLAIGSLSDLG